MRYIFTCRIHGTELIYAESFEQAQQQFSSMPECQWLDAAEYETNENKTI